MQDCQSVEVVDEIQEVEEVQEVVVPLADRPREYVNFIGIEKIGKDSRLAWIAYKYYAQKDLWVFIYEANRDIIKHPSHVREGQVIRIPELSEEYRNLYNPKLKQLVDSLAVEYLKK
jgi:phage tail protein X